jgi:hypothetical protein
VKIGRTLLFLANLARAVPVNPFMLIDTTHHAADRDAAHEVVADHPVLLQASEGKVAEARGGKSSGPSRSG